VSSEEEAAAGRVSGLTQVPERLYAGYVFDLDGTIYLGSELLPGAARLVPALRDLDRKVVFVSNNPTRDPEEYARKLSDLGLPTPASAVINTVSRRPNGSPSTPPTRPSSRSARSRSSARCAGGASACPKTRRRSTS
jgi:Haloacid dehalogenase-like hydrolase